MSSTTIADRSLLVTGATRGIGQALVEEALRRDAKQVYAGTRQPLAHNNDRVAYLILDVTNAAQVQAAVAGVESLDILIYNAGRGVRVHAVLPGPVDTDMSRGADVPKAYPESVSRAVFHGPENGEVEIVPDPLSESMAESWRSSAAKALERKYGALIAAEPAHRK